MLIAPCGATELDENKCATCEEEVCILWPPEEDIVDGDEERCWKDPFSIACGEDCGEECPFEEG